jgi:predicted RNase H-like HicB family nuclease
MRLEIKITKSGRWWAVEAPLLLVYTQGRTKKEALAMMKDAVECLVDEAGFEASVSEARGETFSVGGSDEGLLMSLALKQQRANHKLTVREVASRLGSKSPTAYSRYEAGKTKLSLDKFSQLLRAIDPGLEPILKVG